MTEMTPEQERALMGDWFDQVAFTETPPGDPEPDADDPDDDYATV
jgi:hypothetical protein